MACWLAPAVAAEFLDIHVNEVWNRVNAGHYPIRDDGGFQFIDVMPGQVIAQPALIATQPSADAALPIATPTYLAVTGEESDALTQPLALATADIDESDETTSDSRESESYSYQLSDWQRARSNAASQRKRPAA